MKRRWVRLTCAAFVLVLGGFACWVHLHRERVTEANCETIKIGMTSAELNALFGRKPDNIAVASERREHRWVSSELTISAIIDDTDQVVRYESEVRAGPWYARWLDAVKRSVGR